MAAFVAFELWIPMLAAILRAFGGATVPTAVQVLGSLFGLAVPTVVGLALSDYLADRKGLVPPYQPKRRAAAEDESDVDDEDDEDDEFDGDEAEAFEEKEAFGDEEHGGHAVDALEHEVERERNGRR